MIRVHLDNRDVLALIHFYFVLAALAFFILVMAGEYPMKPEIYGSAVYFIPAEAWSGFLFVAHGAAAIGTWTEMRYLTAIGALSSVLAYVAFSVLALSAQFGDLVVIFSAFVNAPIHLTIGLQAMGGGARGRNGE